MSKCSLQLYKAILITATIGGTSILQAQPNNLTENSNSLQFGFPSLENIKSDIKLAEFTYGDFYFSSDSSATTPSKFISSINKCITHSLKSINKDSQGYKVKKSLGYSDEEITTDGIMLCMEAKSWVLYKRINGSIERTDYRGLTYKSMSEIELGIATKLLTDQNEWFKKYAPQVLD